MVMARIRIRTRNVGYGMWGTFQSWIYQSMLSGRGEDTGGDGTYCRSYVFVSLRYSILAKLCVKKSIYGFYFN